MKRRPYRLRLIITFIMVCALLSGCGLSGGVAANHRALDKIRLVRTLGYDSAGGAVTLSASSGKQGEDGEILLLRRSGDSIFYAMDSLQDYSTQGQLFFSHTQYIVLGRETAEAGIGPLLDFVERDVQMRLGTELFVLKNSDADMLVLGNGDDSYDVTEVLTSAKQDIVQRAASHVSTVRETAVALSEQGAALVCLLRAVETEGSVKLEKNGLTAVPDGFGILKEGKLVGALDQEQAEAVTLLLGHPGTVSRTFSLPGGGEITMQFDRLDGGVEASWNEDGTPGPVRVSLKVRAAVAGTDGGDDGPGPETLTAALEQSLEDDLSEALALSKTLNADFLAVGKQLRLSGGERYQALPADWLERMEFDLSAEAVIGRSFDLSAPAGADGGNT